MSEELAGPSDSEKKNTERNPHTFICYDPAPVDTKQVTVAELIKRNQQDPQDAPPKPRIHRRAFDDDL